MGCSEIFQSLLALKKVEHIIFLATGYIVSGNYRCLRLIALQRPDSKFLELKSLHYNACFFWEKTLNFFREEQFIDIKKTSELFMYSWTKNLNAIVPLCKPKRIDDTYFYLIRPSQFWSSVASNWYSITVNAICVTPSYSQYSILYCKYVRVCVASHTHDVSTSTVLCRHATLK